MIEFNVEQTHKSMAFGRRRKDRVTHAKEVTNKMVRTYSGSIELALRLVEYKIENVYATALTMNGCYSHFSEAILLPRVQKTNAHDHENRRVYCVFNTFRRF